MAKKLQPVGFFHRLSRDSARAAIAASQRATANSREMAIIKYLKSGHEIYRIMGPVFDIMKNDPVVICAPAVFTDGKWAWPEYLSYYVDHYHINLDEVFVQHMIANQWRVPPELDLSSIELDV